MNSKVAIAEVRLGGVVAEARQYVTQLRDLRDAIEAKYREMPKSLKKSNADLLEVIARTDELRKRLNKEISDAQNAIQHIQGHRKWKEAVLALFGQEGLQRCFIHMAQESKEEETA